MSSSCKGKTGRHGHARAVLGPAELQRLREVAARVDPAPEPEHEELEDAELQGPVGRVREAPGGGEGHAHAQHRKARGAGGELEQRRAPGGDLCSTHSFARTVSHLTGTNADACRMAKFSARSAPSVCDSDSEN